MNGGALEYTAAYINNNNLNLKAYGLKLTVNRTSNKYYTVYNTEDKNDSQEESYQATDYELNRGMLGDAIYETSSSCADSTSWGNTNSVFISGWSVFIGRGGSVLHSSSGVFAFYGANGHVQEWGGCRMALVP